MSESEKDCGTFVDDQGRTWVVRLTVGLCRKINDRFSLDALNAWNGKFVTALAADSALLLDVLWLCVEQQANRDGVTQEQFFDGLGPTAFAQLAEAIQDAVLGFTLPAGRAALREIMRKDREAKDYAVTWLREQDQTAILKEKLDQELAKTLKTNG